MSGRRVAQLLALFGLYAIIGTRIVGLGPTSGPSPTMLMELAVLTALLLIGAIFIFTRPVRAPLD
jgi:hypothetical protein